MSLQPAAWDANREKELSRKEKDPFSFGDVERHDQLKGAETINAQEQQSLKQQAEIDENEKRLAAQQEEIEESGKRIVAQRRIIEENNKKLKKGS